MKNTHRRIAFIHIGNTHEDLPIIIDNLKQKYIESIRLHIDDIDNFNFNNIDLICLRHCRGYHLMPDFIDKLNQLKNIVTGVIETPPIINPIILAREAVDKKLYLKWLEHQDIHIIPTLWLAKQQPITLNKIVQKTLWTDFVIKPTISSKSWQTYRVLKRANNQFEVISSKNNPCLFDAETVLQRMLTTHDLCVQKFMPEILDLGEISFIFIEGIYSHAITKTVDNNGWIAHEFFGGKNHLFSAKKNDIDWADSIYNKLALRYGNLAYARIDGIYDSKMQLRLLECELLVPRLFLLEADKVDHYVNSLIRLLP